MKVKWVQTLKRCVYHAQRHAHVIDFEADGHPAHRSNRFSYMEDIQGQQQVGPDKFIWGTEGKIRHSFGSGGN